MNFTELSQLSNQELYKVAKSTRDLLIKRRNNLQRAYQNDPTNISPFGLRSLTGDGVSGGIPLVSTKMGRVTLKATVEKLLELKDMKTSTVRGARQHQESVLRQIINVPEGRLNKTDRTKLNAFKQEVSNEYNQTGRDIPNEFWTAYSDFKQTYASHIPYLDQLDAYRQAYSEVSTSNMSIDQLKDALDTWGEADYKQNQKKSQQITFNKKGGFGF